jgi:ribosomal protein L37AE/L43A
MSCNHESCEIKEEIGLTSARAMCSFCNQIFIVHRTGDVLHNLSLGLFDIKMVREIITPGIHQSGCQHLIATRDSEGIYTCDECKVRFKVMKIKSEAGNQEVTHFRIKYEGEN